MISSTLVLLTSLDTYKFLKIDRLLRIEQERMIGLLSNCNLGEEYPGFSQAQKNIRPTINYQNLRDT